MSIRKWFCICLFFKLQGAILNAPSTKNSVLDDTSRKAIAQRIDDLIQKFENVGNVEEVVMTQGYCTIWEGLKWLLIPGYQPEAVGTQANPLIQHTFKRINTEEGSIPVYGATTIAPTQTPYVKESSRYLTPDQVKKLKKSADKIIKDIHGSPENIRFA